jgi:catechol 2,3-dioxygenase-like lactoylglutathione lyase family enzyme
MTTHTHVGAIAVLPVTEMEPCISFYRSIGFEVVSYDEGYAWVSHLGHELLHLRHVPDLAVGMNEAACYLHVSDADAFHSALPDGLDAGPIADQPWGMREFALTDPSGNTIRIGQLADH